MVLNNNGLDIYHSSGQGISVVRIWNLSQISLRKQEDLIFNKGLWGRYRILANILWDLHVLCQWPVLLFSGISLLKNHHQEFTSLHWFLSGCYGKICQQEQLKWDGSFCLIVPEEHSQSEQGRHGSRQDHRGGGPAAEASPSSHT